MKNESNILFLTMLINLMVALIKLVSGVMFNFSSLIADSLHSFSDFFTDIISNIASKLGKKKSNKRYPFGYGLIENISNLVIGFILILLGIFILVNGFLVKEVIISPVIFIVLIVSIILKLIVIILLYYNGKKLNSNTLIVSVKESATDLISSMVVLIISVLLIFKDRFPILRYTDVLGSVIISIIVFDIAFKIVKENIQYLLGVNENDKETLDLVRDIVDKYDDIKDYSYKLMKLGSYYNLYLVIELNDNITLKRVFNIENNIKKKIRNKVDKIKFVEIELKKYD